MSSQKALAVWNASLCQCSSILNSPRWRPEVVPQRTSSVLCLPCKTVNKMGLSLSSSGAAPVCGVKEQHHAISGAPKTSSRQCANWEWLGKAQLPEQEIRQSSNGLFPHPYRGEAERLAIDRVSIRR